MATKYRFPVYTIPVTAANQSYPMKFDLDKNIKVLWALRISADQPQLLFYRGTQRIELSGDELYPDGTESKVFMSGINTPPDDKWRSIEEGAGLPTGNEELKVIYVDADNPKAVFAPYNVYITLKCEIDDGSGKDR